jgi:hypothetical protein
VNVDQETVYWLLSTAAQVYAALIAVFGALAVYRFHISSQYRRDLRQRVVDILFHFRDHVAVKTQIVQDPHYVPTDELEKYWENRFPKELKVGLERAFPYECYSLIDGFKSITETSIYRKGLLRMTAVLTAIFLTFVSGSLYGLFYISYWLSDRPFLVHLTEFALAATFILASVYFWIVFIWEPKVNGGDSH